MAELSVNPSIDYATHDSCRAAVAIVSDPPLGSFERYCLVVLLALAALLRFHGISRHCFWVDEAATVQLSSGHPLGVFDFPTDRLLPGGFWSTDPYGGSVVEVVRAVRGDTHPPLYLLTLRFWRQIFGPGDAATRSLSAVCGILAIAFLWDAVRVLHGRTAAWWAAILMTVASPQIEFAQEARSYMMVVMWTAFSLAATARIVARGPSRRRQIALGLGLLAAMCTHYYAGATLAAVAAFGLFQPRFIRNALIRVCIIAGVIFAITIGPLLWSQRPHFHGNMTWISDDTPGIFVRTLGRIAVLPLRWFIIPLVASLGVAAVSSVLYILPWLRLRQQPRLALWLLMMTSTVGLAASADLVNKSKSIFQLRYTLPASVAAYAVVSVFLLDRSWLRHLLPGCLLLGCLIGLPQAYEQSHKINWDVLGKELAVLAKPDEPIVFYQENADDWHGPVLQVGVTRYGHLWDRSLLAITRPIDSATRAELIRRKSFWIVTGTASPPIQRFIAGAEPTGRGVPAPFVGGAIEYQIRPSASAPATTP